MAKKPEAKGAVATKAAGSASKKATQTITVMDGDKTPHDELMKLPKVNIVKNIVIPENRTRFLVDVDNRTPQGKRIIALLECLRDGDSAAIKTVTEILEALAGMMAKKPTSKE